MNKYAQSKIFLREQVSLALQDYFSTLEGSAANNIYELVLAEVEAPLLKLTLEHAKGNQSLAAKWLGLNRGTLRKLLSKYNLCQSAQ
jgi:Fis family transcriptional regulator